jgi:hypothetical protein
VGIRAKREPSFLTQRKRVLLAAKINPKSLQKIGVRVNYIPTPTVAAQFTTS